MNKSTAVIGSLLIFLGLFFLLKSLDLIWFDFGDLVSVLLPLALIAVGLRMISRRKKGVSADSSYQFTATATANTAKPVRPEPASMNPTKLAQNQAESSGLPSPPSRLAAEEAAKESPATHPSGKLRFNKMIGEMFIDCEGFNLSNVEVSAGVGDVDIKISGGILSKGLNRMIVSGFIGDIKIFVPRDLAYFAHCSNFVGDVEIGGKRASGFGNTVEHQSVNYDKAESKLYIAANNFIGEMKIYQV